MPPELPDPVKDISSPSSLKRKAAVYALGSLHDRVSLGYIHTALKDTHPNVRAQAAIALGKRKEPESVPVLISALMDDSSDVRQAVLQALIRIRDPMCAEPALPLLNDPDFRVRIGALRLLGMTGSSDILPLVSANLADPVSEVREEAEQALVRLRKKAP